MPITRTDDFNRTANPVGGSFTVVQGAIEADGDEAAVVGGAATDSYARHSDNPTGEQRSKCTIGNLGVGGAGYVGACVCLKASGGNATGYVYYTDGSSAGAGGGTVAKVVNAVEVAGVSRVPGVAFVAGSDIELRVLFNTPSAGQVTLRAFKNGVQVGADVVDTGTTFGGVGGSGAILTGGSYGINVYGSGRINTWEGHDPSGGAGVTQQVAASGAAHASASALMSVIRQMKGSGVAYSAGATTFARLRPLQASGVARGSGSAAASRRRNVAASGAAMARANAAVNRIRNFDQLIGFALGTGYATGDVIHGVGGIKELAASGAAFSRGAALANVIRGLRASGVAFGAGAAQPTPGWELRASGVARGSGSAQLSVVRPLRASGIALSGGSALLNVVGSLTIHGRTWVVVHDQRTWVTTRSGRTWVVIDDD